MKKIVLILVSAVAAGLVSVETAAACPYRGYLDCGFYGENPARPVPSASSPPRSHSPRHYPRIDEIELDKDLVPPQRYYYYPRYYPRVDEIGLDKRPVSPRGYYHRYPQAGEIGLDKGLVPAEGYYRYYPRAGETVLDKSFVPPRMYHYPRYYRASPYPYRYAPPYPW